MSAAKRRKGALYYCTHQLSNHMFTKTPNIIKTISVTDLQDIMGIY